MGRVTGSVQSVKRKRSGGWKGVVYYLVYRLPNGKQVRRKLGPAWSSATAVPGRSLHAERRRRKLREALVDAERQASANPPGSPSATPPSSTCASSSDVRKIDAKTPATTAASWRATCSTSSGTLPLDDVTPDASTPTRNG